MPTYRKKPVEVEAWQWDEDFSEAPEWFLEAVEDGEIIHYPLIPEDRENDLPFLIVKTLEGNHIANLGDYIIQGVKGELYPCKPDIFKHTYEEVSIVTESIPDDFLFERKWKAANISDNA